MNVAPDTNAAHAVYSMSGSPRWIPCTASALGIATLGEQEEGEEAAKGTRAHDELERRLGALNGEFVDPATMPILPSDPDHPSAYGVAMMIAYIRNLPPGRMWVEQRVALTDQIWGRADIQHWHEETATLTIPDLKDGFVGVDPDSEQLRLYGAASMVTHKLPVKWFRFVVVQPNDFRPVPRIKQMVETVESLRAWAEQVATIPNGPLTFVAGEHCTYCPLFGRCPPTKDLLQHLSAMMQNPPDAVPPAQVALFKACQKPVADWFKALDKAETKKALAGSVAPGMKLVTATTHRAWENEAEARTAVIAEAGIDALRTPSPAQAEELGMDVSALAKSPPGGPVLAFASDKRKPFAAKSSSEMFAGIPGVSPN